LFIHISGSKKAKLHINGFLLEIRVHWWWFFPSIVPNKLDPYSKGIFRSILILEFFRGFRLFWGLKRSHRGSRVFQSFFFKVKMSLKWASNVKNPLAWFFNHQRWPGNFYNNQQVIYYTFCFRIFEMACHPLIVATTSDALLALFL